MRANAILVAASASEWIIRPLAGARGYQLNSYSISCFAAAFFFPPFFFAAGGSAVDGSFFVGIGALMAARHAMSFA